MKRKSINITLQLLLILALFFGACDNEETEPIISYRLSGLEGTVRVFYSTGEPAAGYYIYLLLDGGMIVGVNVHGGATNSNGIATMYVELSWDYVDKDRFPIKVTMHASPDTNNIVGATESNIIYRRIEVQGNLHIYRGEFSGEIILN